MKSRKKYDQTKPSNTYIIETSGLKLSQTATPSTKSAIIVFSGTCRQLPGTSCVKRSCFFPQGGFNHHLFASRSSKAITMKPHNF